MDTSFKSSLSTRSGDKRLKDDTSKKCSIDKRNPEHKRAVRKRKSKMTREEEEFSMGPPSRPAQSIKNNPQNSRTWSGDKRHKNVKPIIHDGETDDDVELSSEYSAERPKSKARGNDPGCSCFPPDHIPADPDHHYSHLGHAKSLEQLRKTVEKRTGLHGKAIRIVKVCFTKKEGKTVSGCPLAKWVIRRSGAEEKVLLIAKHWKGHVCETSWTIISMVVWEGVPATMADDLYTTVSDKLKNNDVVTSRRCGVNALRTCACQGLDKTTCGTSFSFGCSWSMFFDGCKFASSKTARKFRLSVKSEEQAVEDEFQKLATFLSPIFRTMAPECYLNMTQFEEEAVDCRLGLQPGRPWSGVTVCLDFCAHSHKDTNNMNNGCTTVVTLTKRGRSKKPGEEQLHVLPLYTVDESDERGSRQGYLDSVKSGAIEVLTNYPCEVRTRQTPLLSRKKMEVKRKAEREHSKRAPAYKMRKSLDISSASPQTSKHNLARASQTPPPRVSPHAPGAEPQDLLGSVTDFTNNEDCFSDPEVGGVAIALSHGSLLFEVAKHELHATTALKNPNRSQPTRMSLVFYQHKSLNRSDHGRGEYAEKRRLKAAEKNVGRKSRGNGAPH